MLEKYILPLLCATSEHTEIIFLKYISINETFLLILSSIILRWIFGRCRKCCSFLSSLTFLHEMCPWGRAHDHQFLIRCVSHKSEFFLLSSWHIPLIVSQASHAVMLRWTNDHEAQLQEYAGKFFTVSRTLPRKSFTIIMHM